MNQEHHQMVLEMTHASGMQGWYCPSCGRRLLFLVPPNSEMVVVEPGDLYATHSGSLGGLRIGVTQIIGQDEEPEELSEKSLRPWIKALESLNLDW